jgi:hypothetical protein
VGSVLRRSYADRRFSRPGYTSSTHPQHERRIVPPQGKQSKTWQGGSVLDGQVDHSYASASGSLLDGQWIRFMLTIAEQGL